MELSDIRHYEPLFGSWKVGGLIGGGGFGAVYRAVKDDFGFKQEAAVKIIDVKKDEKLLKLVRQEVQNLLNLNGHPNIVLIKDCKIETQKYDGGNDVLILMELLSGLDEKNMSPEQVAKLGADICRALEMCANNNIIHRDIKPANILVSPDGHYKLSDFGISRTLAAHGASTNIGTPEFKAPEVAMYRKYDARADIYSLGLTMYYLLNGGKPPFSGEDALTRRLEGEAPPPPRNAPDYLSAIILKACAFDPDKRYNTAREMRGALEGRTAAGFDMPAAAVNITGAPRSASTGAEESFKRGKEFYDKKEYEKAFAHYLTAAEQGNARAQFNLALMYDNGKGVSQDDAKAVEWYHKAAEQGHAAAQNCLGCMYAAG
jgi:serine/threonine protein kinase